MLFVPVTIPLTSEPLRQTAKALDETATVLATYARPEPSVTFYGEGYSSYERTAQLLRDFDNTATWVDIWLTLTATAQQ